MTDFDRDHILAAIGQFAKTLRHIPHEYAVRGPENEAAYVALAEAILEHGVRERYVPEKPRRPYWNRYLYPGDGWKYWLMTTALGQSRILNRARVEDDHEVVLERARRAARRNAPAPGVSARAAERIAAGEDCALRRAGPLKFLSKPLDQVMRLHYMNHQSEDLPCFRALSLRNPRPPFPRGYGTRWAWVPVIASNT
jgi:hypothetical protein